jgi:hypothetical protein
MTQTDFPANPRSLSVSARLGRLQFHLSGKFRVLQVADIQEGPTVSKDTIRLLERACDDARPDLVIFTGNQIKGYDPSFGATFHSRRWTSALVSAFDGADAPLKAGTEDASQIAHPHDYVRAQVRRQAQQFLSPLIKRGIPFAITYGNHDFQCGLSTAELDKIYRSFPGCLNPDPREDSSSARQGCEPGTFALPVWDLPSITDRQISIRTARAVQYPQAARRQGWSAEQSQWPVMSLVLLNSGDYSREGGYGSPSARALAWLAHLKHDPLFEHADPTVFQHFPIPQYYRLLTPVSAYRDGAIEGYRTYAHTCYTLNPRLVLPGSRLGEGISCPDRDSGEYEILQRLHASALLTGHDHRNAFAGRLADGEPLLCATPTSGFGSYGPPADERAVRLVEYDIRHPSDPRTKLLTFGGLVGTSNSRSVYTFASGHVPVNASQTRDFLRKNTVLAGLAGVGAVCVAFFTLIRSAFRKFFTPSPQQS